MSAAGTGITADAITDRLRQTLSPTVLEVQDESASHAGHVGADGTGAGTHFRVRISCQAFTGKTRVAQHRLVYDALGDFMARGLHALTIELA